MLQSSGPCPPVPALEAPVPPLQGIRPELKPLKLKLTPPPALGVFLPPSFHSPGTGEHPPLRSPPHCLQRACASVLPQAVKGRCRRGVAARGPRADICEVPPRGRVLSSARQGRGPGGLRPVAPRGPSRSLQPARCPRPEGFRAAGPAPPPPPPCHSAEVARPVGRRGGQRVAEPAGRVRAESRQAEQGRMRQRCPPLAPWRSASASGGSPACRAMARGRCSSASEVGPGHAGRDGGRDGVCLPRGRWAGPGCPAGTSRLPSPSQGFTQKTRMIRCGPEAVFGEVSANQ